MGQGLLLGLRKKLGLGLMLTPCGLRFRYKIYKFLSAIPGVKFSPGVGFHGQGWSWVIVRVYC